MPQMRLDKLLSHLNCGSRKEVQALIRAGRVSVDGTVQKDPAFKVDPDRSQTAVDGTVQRLPCTAVLHAQPPMGVITASRDERHDTVLELFPDEPRRGLFAVEGWTRTPRDCCSSRTTARSAMR
ncbi:MAG: S4 domain-containing protein [Butyricicoccus sp.]